MRAGNVISSAFAECARHTQLHTERVSFEWNNSSTVLRWGGGKLWLFAVWLRKTHKYIVFHRFILICFISFRSWLYFLGLTFGSEDQHFRLYETTNWLYHLIYTEAVARVRHPNTLFLSLILFITIVCSSISVFNGSISILLDDTRRSISFWKLSMEL